MGGGEPRNGWGHGQMGGLIPTSTPARPATSLPVHPATHPSVHPAASLLLPEPQGALDGLREAERSAAFSAGSWRGSTTQTGDRQALQPLQEKWGFLKRCWRGFENSVQFEAAETLGFSGLRAWAPAVRGRGARVGPAAREPLATPAQGRVLRPPEHEESAQGAGRVSPEPRVAPPGLSGSSPGTLTPSSAEAPPTKKAALTGSCARRVMRLPARRWKRGPGVVVMRRLRHPRIGRPGCASGDPHPGAEAGLRARRSARAPLGCHG